MERIAKVFKEVRLSKHMSLTEVAGDFISPAQLSRFENGKSNLSVDTFFRCLLNMGVFQGEFMAYYHNLYWDDDERVHFADLYKSFEEEEPLFLLRQLESYQVNVGLPLSRNERLEAIVLEASLAQIDSGSFLAEDSEAYLAHYMLSFDYWGRQELWILGICAPGLTSELLKILSKEVLHRSNILSSDETTMRLCYKATLAMVDTFLNRRDIKAANQLLSGLNQRKIPEYYMQIRLHMVFCRSRIRFLQGDQHALKKMQECERMLEFVGAYKLASQMNKLIRIDTDM